MSYATYLALNITEWFTDVTKAETTLSFKGYAAATPAKYCNFTWDATSKMYNSTCCVSSTTIATNTRDGPLTAGDYTYYTNNTQVSGTCASTATTAEIQAFDTVDIMYGTKSFYTLNSTTLSSYDITAAQIKSAAASFTASDFLQYEFGLAQFKLFWISFGTTDISKLKITLTDSSSNVLSIFKHPYLTTDAVTRHSYGTYNLSAYDSITGAILYTKEFVLTATTTGIIRNVITDFSVVAAPTDSEITTSGDSVLPITVRVNLTAESETGFKSADTVTYLETGCSELYLEFTNNNTVLQAGYTNSLCYYAFVSNTNLLVPGKFTITAYTVSSGVKTTTVSWTSSTQLTPAMIGSWVVSSSTTTPVIISASYMSDNDKLTGGAIAAIVIGSFCGAVIIVFFLVLLIRFCAYGCAQHTTTMM